MKPLNVLKNVLNDSLFLAVGIQSFWAFMGAPFARVVARKTSV